MELLEETGVKVRGLPYSFNAWDIEEIFTSYSFIRGSVKLGHRGTSRSGEAIILFPNKGEGVRSLALNGVVV